jgi:DNA-binding NarL/FixJ family response regulator
MNKIKCLEPLLSTFEAVFPSRRQPTATLLLLSSPEQRRLSPYIGSEDTRDSQDWPFEPVSNPADICAPNPAQCVHPPGDNQAALNTGQAEVETRSSHPSAETMPIRVAIVEDDRAVRENLAVLISESPQFNCVATCASAEAALQELPGFRPDVVLMDIHLPDKNGIECVRDLRERLPRTQVIMLTIEENPERVFESLKAGATGYLVKHASPREILDAVTEVHRGGAPMSSQIARKVVTAFREPFRAGGGQLPGIGEDFRLSEREEQVLRLLAKGYRSKEIGIQLGIGFTTVNTYIRNIYDKLHVRSRAEAVAVAARSRRRAKT